MYELLNSNFFNKNYGALQINFWGGEPSLNLEPIFQICQEFENDARVSYFIYTNGTRIDKFINLLEKYKYIKNVNNMPKFMTQISYDGEPIHDIYRKNKQEKLTGTFTKGKVQELLSMDIPVIMKSTLPSEAFKYMVHARNDILSIYEPFMNKGIRFGVNYSPTVEYYNLNKITNVPEVLETLKSSLFKMVELELDYYRKNNRFFFNWFNENKALCSAGRDLICINWDGKIFKCHGSIYEDGNLDHCIGDIEDDTWIEGLVASHKIHSFNFGYLPPECKGCEANFCLKCNHAKFMDSEKTHYLDKWRDYTSQPVLCQVYQLNGKIVKDLKEKIK
jgi:radical SAM protein with 4Fe4S-binding SPASM domain